MNSSKMIYDIRNSTNAQQTLVSLTGVPLSIWKQNVGREREFQYADDLVEYVVSSYGKLPENYRDFHFVYFHITTSANGCASFRKHGILDLPNSYLCADSELRVFLENHNIYIDLQHEVLRYGEKTFNIHYGRCPRQDTEEYHCWSVGRKFYYDFTTCGFLSVWKMSPYGGQVHHRPEFLIPMSVIAAVRQLAQTGFGCPEAKGCAWTAMRRMTDLTSERFSVDHKYDPLQLRQAIKQ